MPGKLLLTSYGFNDAGGGTAVPRLTAKELARRGWDVTVFHAATARDPSGEPYAVREWEEDGVRLVGVHNRAHGIWDLGHPDRELDDPPITAAFAETLDRVGPDVVHFHNLANLGAALLDATAARGLPAYFSTHNYWLICPRAYLMREDGALCAGPADRGAGCAACVESHDAAAHARRLAGIRERFVRGIDVCLAVSDAMRATLTAHGYPAERIDVVRQAMPAADATWERLGRDRRPGRAGDVLTVGFFGSAYPHKGPQQLVLAAQRTEQPVRVVVHGDLPDGFDEHLRALDRRGVVELAGAFTGADLPRLLAEVDAAAMPSLWWDCAPLMAAECLAGRVPLLAPRMGGLGEAIRPEVDGLAFDAFDAADLARQLDRLASEDGLLERLQAGIAAPRPFGAYVDELEAYYAGERPSRASRAPRPALRWVGDHDLNTSLSTINRAVAARLGGAADVQRVRRDGAPLDRPLPRVADVEVRHQWPPDFSAPPSGRLALIQPWEFGELPLAWVEPLRATVDEVWVPSELVRAMYLRAGMEADRVHVVPNGVDLERLAPRAPREPGPRTRFLFVGGAIARKGIDVLLSAWLAAFAGRDDAELVVKDFGAGSVYRNADRTALRELAAAGRLTLVEEELDDDALADLYRSCDVLVHPYRGEGFAMPVLEAMAAGLPVIVTAGGPTDEFVPDDACWRIRATRRVLPGGRVDDLPCVGEAWMLEPDAAHLVELLRAAAGDPAARAAKGAAAHAAAQAYGWDAVAGQYAQRAAALAQRPPRLGETPVAPRALDGDPALAVLATPAWRGADALGRLLAAWVAATEPADDAALVLLADPEVDGAPEELEARVLAAAAEGGADLERGADIVVHQEPGEPGRDAAVHAACAAYVPLHGACAGHASRAREVVAVDALGAWLHARLPRLNRVAARPMTVT